MVRLKVGVSDILRMKTQFQFHYGTIKSVIGSLGAIQNSYFNSTMVRLKDLGGHSSTVSVKFQFHYGTIKRN